MLNLETLCKEITSSAVTVSEVTASVSINGKVDKTEPDKKGQLKQKEPKSIQYQSIKGKIGKP